MAYTAPAERDKYLMYLRKSRYDRDYEELSVEETLKRHEAKLTELANNNGLYVADTYREVVSGETIEARPKVQELLKEVKTGNYAGVLVMDIDRLARGDSEDQGRITKVFKNTKTKIVTPGRVYDPTSKDDTRFFEFNLFFGNQEYQTIKDRMVRGREISASEGKYVGSVAPYGYDRVKLPGKKGYTLEPNAEAAVVQKIFQLYTVLHKGTKEIANDLNDSGIPTRHGNPWEYSTILTILSNPVYIGQIRRGYCRIDIRYDDDGNAVKHLRHVKDMSEYLTYPGLHPAIIDEATFDLAQERKVQNSPGPKVRRGVVLQDSFAGLIYCAVCGKRIARTLSSRSRGGKARFRCENSRICHNASANYDLVEAEIIGSLRTWLDGYRVKIDTVGYAEEIEDYRRRIETAEREKVKVKKQLDNASDMREQGEYSHEEFIERRDKHRTRIAELDAEISSAKEKLAALENVEASRANLIPQTEALLESYDEMTPLERNKLLKEIVDRIEYRKDKSGITIDLYPKLPKVQ